MIYECCPYGFVIPNDKIHDSRTKYYEDTNCAYGCIENFYTKDQWSRKQTACFSFGTIGLILSFIFLIVETSDIERRKQYLIVSLAVFTTISSIGVIINSQPGDINEKRFCETNAIKLSMSSGVSACTVQSVLVLFGSLGTSAAWLCQCFDLFFKVCLERKTNTSSYFYGYMSFIIGLPVVMLIYQLASGSAGYGGHLWCVYSDRARTNGFIYVAVAAPVVIICLIGIVLMICVCCTIIKSTYSIAQSKGNVAKILKTLRVPIIFCALYLVVAVTCVYNVILTGTLGPKVYESTSDFHKCIFENFDGINDNSWISVCGMHQKVRYKGIIIIIVTIILIIITIIIIINMIILDNMWLNFCLSGQSIFISLIFLPFALQKLKSESSFRKGTGLRGSIRSSYTVAIADESEEVLSIRKNNQDLSLRICKNDTEDTTNTTATIDIKTGDDTETETQHNDKITE